MLDSNLCCKLLHVKIIFHVLIHRLTNNLCSLLPIFVPPLCVPFGLALHFLLLPGEPVSNMQSVRMSTTYVAPRLQALRIDYVFMEAWPLLERFLSTCLVLL